MRFPTPVIKSMNNVPHNGQSESADSALERGRPRSVPLGLANGCAPKAGHAQDQDPEVPEKASRRRFTAEYKVRIVREADACTEPGQIGALLRREGLYSSHLTEWRRLRDEGGLAGLAPQKRGRKPKLDPQQLENSKLRRENERLAERLRKAEAIIAAQKKIAEILGETLPEVE
jgi:transposase-like protein